MVGGCARTQGPHPPQGGGGAHEVAYDRTGSDGQRGVPLAFAGAASAHAGGVLNGRTGLAVTGGVEPSGELGPRPTRGLPPMPMVKGRGRTVEVLTKQPSVKGPAEIFTGNVWFDVIS